MTEKDFLYLLNQEQREAYFKYKSEHVHTFINGYTLDKYFNVEDPNFVDYCLKKMVHGIAEEILEKKKYKLTRTDSKYQIMLELKVDTIL